MRIMLTSVPAVAHVLALLPLARALTRRGHRVAMLSAGSAGPLLPEDVELLEVGPDLPALLAALGDPATRRNRPDGLPEGVGRFFGSLRVEATIAAAREAAAAWRPDLVVGEGLDGVGTVLAAEHDLPHVTVSLGPVCMADVDAEIRDSLAASGFPLAPTRRLDPWPVVMRPPGWEAPGELAPVRAELALPDDGAGHPGPPPPPVELPPGDGPAVLLTLGSLFATPESLRPAVAALSGAGFRVVVALPPGLEPEPVERVVARPFGPLGAVLERVDAVVCHAGAATVLAAVIHGRPVVTVPLGADHFVNAAGVAASGVGVRTTVEGLAAATAQVVGTPSFTTRAREVATGIAAAPGWDEVVESGWLPLTSPS